MTSLCCDELENLKEDVKKNNFIGNKYLDTWDYEDDYSHNEIEESREQFIEESNNYFEENKLPYIMREVCENARVCDKKTGEVLISN